MSDVGELSNFVMAKCAALTKQYVPAHCRGESTMLTTPLFWTLLVPLVSSNAG
jgi:hypothetical protein